jgi:F-type H+-transporting ATPase subunit b
MIGMDGTTKMIGATGVIKRALRRRILVVALAAGALALGAGARARAAEETAPASGEAAAHETPEIHGGKLGLQVLNFSVLVILLVGFGGRAVKKALLARHQQMKADLAAAAVARAEAEARLAQQEARLSALEQEIEGIRKGVKAEAEAEKARLIAMAQERAKRIKEETSFVLDQQVKEAEARLRREVALAAVTLAEQTIRRSFGAADQQRLVDTFVADVRGATPAGAARGGA